MLYPILFKKEVKVGLIFYCLKTLFFSFIYPIPNPKDINPSNTGEWFKFLDNTITIDKINTNVIILAICVFVIFSIPQR
jgi:hypothetical protein